MRERPTDTRKTRLLLLVVLVLVVVVDSNNLRSPSKPTDNTPSRKANLRLSTAFPTFNETLDMARLSHLVYKFLGHDSCNATSVDGTPLIPKDLQCHWYSHEVDQGTQVLLVTHAEKKYIALVFAGTDNLRTMLTDGDILLKPFGPLDERGNSILLPTEARVHAGFDNAVFRNGIYDAIQERVETLQAAYPGYTIFATGHSLGAADAILTSAALILMHPSWNITTINFGSPRTGNREWRDFLNSGLPNLGVWRFVLGWDLVPRLPELAFVHVGHTLQLDNHDAQAYYLHHGNKTLGYAGVPVGWSEKPFIWVPGALESHSMHHYLLYFQDRSAVDPSTFYCSEFARIPNTTLDDDSVPDPPDDDFEFESEKEETLFSVRNFKLRRL